MRLESLKARLNRLLEVQGPPDGPPACVITLPACGRGTDEDEGKPLPRVAWRNRCAACIVYDPAVGQPSAEAIARLIEAQP